MGTYGDLADLQAEGICGEQLRVGGRCENRITEWIPTDPDKPEGEKVGACGIHTSDVAQRIKMNVERAWGRDLAAYEAFTAKQLEATFNRLGIVGKMGNETKTVYDRNTGARQYTRQWYFVITSPGEFLHHLHEMGYVNKFEELRGEPCGQRQAEWSKRVCIMAAGHDSHVVAHCDEAGGEWRDPCGAARPDDPTMTCEHEWGHWIDDGLRRQHRQHKNGYVTWPLEPELTGEAAWKE